MRILHLSDNHGNLKQHPDAKTADLIVHTGDFLPNRTRGIRVIEEQFQADWVEKNTPRIAEYFADKPVLFVPGNHDFIDPTIILRAGGVEVQNIADRLILVDEVSFYGFPWVNHFTGEWNYEIRDDEMATRFQEVPTVDVLCCHSPIYGVLDRNAEGERCGSPAIRRHIEDRLPMAYLHGHIHDSAGYVDWKRVRVSNAAMTGRIVTL